MVAPAQVEAHASVTAEELPWLSLLQGVIEAAMSAQSRRVVETFLLFTKRECAQYQARMLRPTLAPCYPHACRVGPPAACQMLMGRTTGVCS
jgi:hypothetical protein